MLVAQYQDGESIDGLARAFDINRTTVIRHLEVSGVARRRLVRKMTDQNVADATARYAEGYPLAAVAQQFDVWERTLKREFEKAGVETRGRRGLHVAPKSSSTPMSSTTPSPTSSP